MQVLSEPCTIPGSVFDEHVIKSDVTLVTPTVAKLTSKLLEMGWIQRKAKVKIELCFDEAITNAVVHGNKSDLNKKVTISLWRDSTSWGVVIEDEGEGFDLEKITSRPEEESLWREDGRGLALLTLYMDEVTYYKNGSTLLLRQDFAK